MADLKFVLTANNEVFGEVINWGIFQGDSLSPFIFVIAMTPLSILLRRERLGYFIVDGGLSVNHLLFMDNQKLLG